MVITEKNVEDYLKIKVEDAGGMYIKLPAIYTEGIPDRLILMPGGKLAFAELKRPKGGSLSALQRDYWLPKLTRLGFVARRVRNYEEADDLVWELQR